MVKSYILQEREGNMVYSDALIVDSPEALKIVDHPIRMEILELLAKKPMYPAELAKVMKMHEQKIYYHVKQMTNSGVLDVVDKEEIRGTVAKKLAPKYLNFAFIMSKEWRPVASLIKKRDSTILKFLNPFIQDTKLNSHLVVGSPDPHGPHKARARDGHYAIDLALFLGGLCSMDDNFSTKLDVDIDLKKSENLILVGGPVTNHVVSKINDFLPAKFSDKKPWGIITKKTTYTEESIGLISRIPNPYNPEYFILLLAGIRFIGTKAAVFAFTRNYDLVVHRYTGQKEFFSIVQGFDLDGDGKIDNIEVLE